MCLQTKLQVDGSIKHYKTSLVAKDFTHVKGLNYNGTFAHVAQLVTIRCLLAIVATKHWIIQLLDIYNAFLHGDLDDEVYVKPPSRYCHQGEMHVCRLHKSLYGLKQAFRQWLLKLSHTLILAFFCQSMIDHSLFIKT